MPNFVNIDKLIEPTSESDSISSNEKTINVNKENYEFLVLQIENHFELLKNSLENRKLKLLDELKSDYEKNNLNDKLYELQLNEYGDFEILIKNYAKIQQKITNELSNEKNSSNQVECLLDGIGLRECFVNKTSRFTITFKNRTISRSNVSFLDIFIVTTSNDNSKKSITPADTIKQENGANKHRKISSADNNNNNNQCNCDCKLEFIADGLYAVNYKLDKPGIYLLNILGIFFFKLLLINIYELNIFKSIK